MTIILYFLEQDSLPEQLGLQEGRLGQQELLDSEPKEERLPKPLEQLVEAKALVGLEDDKVNVQCHLHHSDQTFIPRTDNEFLFILQSFVPALLLLMAFNLKPYTCSLPVLLL